MFHVKHRRRLRPDVSRETSLADAEAGEDPVEHVLRPDPAADLRQARAARRRSSAASSLDRRLQRLPRPAQMGARLGQSWRAAPGSRRETRRRSDRARTRAASSRRTAAPAPSPAPRRSPGIKAVPRPPIPGAAAARRARRQVSLVQHQTSSGRARRGAASRQAPSLADAVDHPSRSAAPSAQARARRTPSASIASRSYAQPGHVGEQHLKPASTSGASITSRVVPGRRGDDGGVAPGQGVEQADLPALGAPTSAMR